ncbi:MAG: GEVED domain-containing protein [Bacteroidetes bacterium]|nr:GEVED domain-containing protein [Bacteroidota bacterium]
MKLKSTILTRSMFLLFSISLVTVSNARPLVYCVPTFLNGCTQWNNHTITLNTINWTIGATACTVSDYTSQSTTLTAGTSYPMTVINGAWCGCSVWIDFNQNQVFDTIENLYHSYQGNSPTFTYNFNIAIPATAPNGTYRMRVIGPWGSDGYTVGSGNGWGGCGSYQYGNFEDFTVTIVGSVGIPNIAGNNLPVMSASPNPATTEITVTMNDIKGKEAKLQLMDITGKLIRTIDVRSEKEVLDIADLSKGIYILHYADGDRGQDIRLVK